MVLLLFSHDPTVFDFDPRDKKQLEHVLEEHGDIIFTADTDSWAESGTQPASDRGYYHVGHRASSSLEQWGPFDGGYRKSFLFKIEQENFQQKGTPHIYGNPVRTVIPGKKLFAVSLDYEQVGTTPLDIVMRLRRYDTIDFDLLGPLSEPFTLDPKPQFGLTASIENDSLTFEVDPPPRSPLKGVSDRLWNISVVLYAEKATAAASHPRETFVFFVKGKEVEKNKDALGRYQTTMKIEKTLSGQSWESFLKDVRDKGLTLTASAKAEYGKQPPSKGPNITFFEPEYRTASLVSEPTDVQIHDQDL